MNTMTKSLLFGASLLAFSGAAFAADQKPQQRAWVQPPAWVMLLGHGDQIATVGPERMAYAEKAINPNGEAGIAEAK